MATAQDPPHSDEQRVAGIPRAEFAQRQQRAREALDAQGFDGLLVVARGGGPFERYADLLYLTGFYPTFPTIVDLPGHWRLRGHALLALGADGATLIADEAPDADAVSVDGVRESTDPISEVPDALASAGGRGRVGIIGLDELPTAARAEFERTVGELHPVDELVADLRRLKSPAEQDRLREAGRVGSAAIEAALRAAGAGTTTQQAAAAAAASCVGSGAAVVNIFAGTYGPDRERPSRQFPSYADDVPMRPGDVFTIDMSGALDGYFFDFSRSRVIDEDDRHGGRAALAAAQHVVETTVAALRAGVSVGDVATIGERARQEVGAGGRHGGFDALGHGLGLGFEAPWLTTTNTTTLEAGMCIAVEQFISAERTCAAFEHDVLITDGEPEILSTAVRDASELA